MNILLEFTPDLIVYFYNPIDIKKETPVNHTWGDKQLWEHAGIFIREKTIPFREGFIYVQKGTLKYQIVELEMNHYYKGQK